jgi:nucleoside-diphosphate-sugar epimerase
MILLTGATGFIGRAIAMRLRAAGRPVAVLARGRDGVDARARVAAALGDAAGGVEVVEGELSAEDAALAPSALRRLRERVETVMHCAGDTSFAPLAVGPYVGAHVDGPVALLRALAGGRLARWAQLSTAFVCGARGDTVHEHEGDVGQDFHNVYERAKLAAESALRAAGAAAGVDVRVLRPAIVVGAAPATAGGNPSNLFFAFIRLAAALAQWPAASAARLRVLGAPHAPFNLVPLDYVVEATLALAERPDAAGGTFHLVVRDAPPQRLMAAMLAERLGLTGLALLDAARDTLHDPSPLERQVARMIEPYRDYFLQDVRFDDAAAAAALARAGIARPTLGPADVGRLIDLALVTEAAGCDSTAAR